MGGLSHAFRSATQATKRENGGHSPVRKGSAPSNPRRSQAGGAARKAASSDLRAPGSGGRKVSIGKTSRKSAKPLDPITAAFKPEAPTVPKPSSPGVRMAYGSPSAGLSGGEQVSPTRAFSPFLNAPSASTSPSLSSPRLNASAPVGTLSALSDDCLSPVRRLSLDKIPQPPPGGRPSSGRSPAPVRRHVIVLRFQA